MLTLLKKLVGIDERSIKVEKEYQEKAEDFDEANKHFEELQKRLDSVGKKTKKRCEDLSRTLSVLSERPPLDSEAGEVGDRKAL